MVITTFGTDVDLGGAAFDMAGECLICAANFATDPTGAPTIAWGAELSTAGAEGFGASEVLLGAAWNCAGPTASLAGEDSAVRAELGPGVCDTVDMRGLSRATATEVATEAERGGGCDAPVRGASCGVDGADRALGGSVSCGACVTPKGITKSDAGSM